MSAGEDSPFYNYGCGNSETLNSPDIREDLLDFFDTYYNSKNMKLVLYTNDELDVLKEKAKLFEGVRNNEVPKEAFKKENPFED